MAQYVPGSEKFAARPESLEAGLANCTALDFHDVDAAALEAVDPLTYEVIRHRLWAITNEMGSALQRMSGSVIVTEINDFNVAIMDQIGDVAQVGLYNLELSASIDIAVKWTIEQPRRQPRHPPRRHVHLHRPLGRRRPAPERCLRLRPDLRRRGTLRLDRRGRPPG